MRICTQRPGPGTSFTAKARFRRRPLSPASPHAIGAFAGGRISNGKVPCIDAVRNETYGSITQQHVDTARM